MRGTENYKDILNREGLKNTKHRNSILEVIENSNQPISTEEIFLKLKERNISINLSSVYRILESLVSKGLVVKSSITGDVKALFEINRLEHKHHLVCLGCKKIISVDGCPLEEYESQLQAKTGFKIKGHSLEIFGFCKECTNA